MNSMRKIFMVLVVATFMFSFVLATSYATTVSNEKKDTGISIESKEKKVSTYKVTWNANGGKIGTKKTKVTTVKKGSKIGKLVATPKRSGYSFNGGFTKKSGGKKINKNTKVTKKVNFFAHWTKKSSSTSRVLNSEEKKLVGEWHDYFTSGRTTVWVFKKDGTYLRVSDIKSGNTRNRYQYQGNYSIKNGELTTKYHFKQSNKFSGDVDWKTEPWFGPETSTRNIELYVEDGKQFINYLNIKYVKV